MKIRTLIALILQINADNFLGICVNQRYLRPIFGTVVTSFRSPHNDENIVPFRVFLCLSVAIFGAA